MELRTLALVLIVSLCCFIQASSSSVDSTDISIENENVVRRNRHLLQALKSCSVNFQTQDYTIITSKCKGPRYPAEACCNAFLEFACPFADYINDNTTDCASVMFTYINIYGSYPAGLFANECVGNSTNGLMCPQNITKLGNASDSNGNSAGIGLFGSTSHQFLVWFISVASFILLTDLFGFFTNNIN